MIEIATGGIRPFFAPPGAADGVLRVAGQGKSQDFQAANGTAEVSTAGLPIGEYRAFWSWTDENGVDRLVRTEGFKVVSLEGLEWDERVLAKAREVLETAAGTDRVSLSVEGTSFSFEGRQELLAFVNLMERRVRNGRRRAELGISKRGKVYIRSSARATGVWG